MAQDNCLTLCQEIINIFGKALTEIFNRELEEDSYMPQTFLGSKFRASVAIWTAVFKSYRSMVNVLALAIATHRAEEHEENKDKEIASLTKVMSDEEIQTATSRGWWSNS